MVGVEPASLATSDIATLGIPLLVTGAAADFGGVGGPVTGGCALPCGGDADVDAEGAGQDRGGQVGGELEEGGGSSSAGLDAELAQSFDHPEGAEVLSGSSAGEQPWGFTVAADGGVTGSGLHEFADHLVERLGDQDRFSTEPQPHLRPGDLDVVDGELMVVAVWA